MRAVHPHDEPGRIPVAYFLITGTCIGIDDMESSPHWPEGGYWDGLFNDFPSAHIRISRGFVLAYTDDGLMTTTARPRPEDPREAKFWDALQGIRDLI